MEFTDSNLVTRLRHWGLFQYYQYVLYQNYYQTTPFEFSDSELFSTLESLPLVYGTSGCIYRESRYYGVLEDLKVPDYEIVGDVKNLLYHRERFLETFEPQKHKLRRNTKCSLTNFETLTRGKMGFEFVPYYEMPEVRAQIPVVLDGYPILIDYATRVRDFLTLLDGEFSLGLYSDFDKELYDYYCTHGSYPQFEIQPPARCYRSERGYFKETSNCNLLWASFPGSAISIDTPDWSEYDVVAVRGLVGVYESVNKSPLVLYIGGSYPKFGWLDPSIPIEEQEFPPPSSVVLSSGIPEFNAEIVPEVADSWDAYPDKVNLMTLPHVLPPHDSYLFEPYVEIQKSPHVEIHSF